MSTIEFDPAKTIRFLQKKRNERRKSLDRKLQQAEHDFSVIVAMIKKNYAPIRIWQWGSLLEKWKFSEISDIDIALEGINDEAIFFSLYGAADRLTSFPLDIVQLEKIHPLHVHSIQEKGKLIYER